MNHLSVRRSLASIGPALILLAVGSGFAHSAPVVNQATRELVELLFRKGGREVTERLSREVAEQSVETAVSKFGPRATQAIMDGGLELVEAGARYGDDVMRAAVDATPAARRALALAPERILPLVRELGTEAVEIEAKSPGLARRVFSNFGDDGARRIAREVPAEDVPRLLAYAEKADTPATRIILLEAYEKEGASLFQRIPASLVLASGLSAGALYGTHRATAPLQAIADAVATDPVTRRRVTDWSMAILGAVALIVVTFVLSAFGLTPWHARKPAMTSPPASECVKAGDTAGASRQKAGEGGDPTSPPTITARVAEKVPQAGI